MNRIVLLVMVLFSALSAFSQSKEEANSALDKLGIDKTVIIYRFVKPEKKNKEAFDKVYAEYRAEQKIIAQERYALLEEYAEKWESMTNEEADAWTIKAFALGMKRDDILRAYYKKVKDVTNAKLATQFMQAEVYAISTVQNAIFKNMPFVKDDSN